MFEALRHFDSGKLFGLIFVLALHGTGLYGLWSYRIIPTPDEALPPPEPVVEAPPTPPAPPAPPLPAQPVMLSGELSVSCPERSPPNYPVRSRRLNEQGRVLLRVELGEDGHVSGVAIKTSSGFTSLDEAAVSAVKTWRCKPAIQNGVAVRAVALQPFAFILEGR